MQTNYDFEDNSEQMTGRVLAPEDDGPAQMPLGVGDQNMLGEPLGLEAAPRAGSGRMQSALVMLLVVVVAAGALWTMRVTGGVEKVDSSVSAAEQKIEQALARLKSGDKSAALKEEHLDSLFGDTDQVVAIFENDPTKKQIEVDNLNKNPFALVVTQKKSDQAESVAAIDRVKAERMAQLKREFDKLQLQSLLNGSTPLAVVSGKVVRAGDSVGSFDVISIGPGGVKLSAEGNSFTLTMKQPSDKLR